MRKMTNLNIKLEERLMRGFDETTDLVNKYQLEPKVTKSSLVREGMVHIIKKYKRKYGKQAKSTKI